MSNQDKAEGFEECRRQVQLMLSHVPVITHVAVAELGNPFNGMRNAIEWLNCPRGCWLDGAPVQLIPGQRCPECREVAIP